MPANIVKTKADEKKWDRALGISKKQYPDNPYPLAVNIFKKMKRHKQKKAFYEIIREAAENIDKKELIEDLADLEHQQWEGWAKSKIGDVDSETAARWKKLFIPYDKLPEEEKAKDRPFAKKVIKVLEDYDLLS